MMTKASPPIIQIKDLVTCVGHGCVLHDHLSLDVRKGEILGIVGGSGTGKSVLLRTILGLHPAVSGEIYVLGKKLGSLEAIRKEGMASSWGVLFQNGALFSSMTAGENIQVPMKELEGMSDAFAEDLARVKLKMVGLNEADFDKMPEELSGGMVKRTALARALAVDPHILFLDEPTAGLDPIAAAAFDKMILSLRDTLDLTVVMVTHDLDSLHTICDRIAVLVDKHVIVGTLKEVMGNSHPWIQHYFHGARSRAVEGKS